MAQWLTYLRGRWWWSWRRGEHDQQTKEKDFRIDCGARWTKSDSDARPLEEYDVDTTHYVHAGLKPRHQEPSVGAWRVPRTTSVQEGIEARAEAVLFYGQTSD
nr:hypothetical protein BaRGS_007827 [Batillaria attramentaria]